MVLSYSVTYQRKYHVYCYGYFLSSYSIYDAVCLCVVVTTGVGGCEWLIYAREFHMDVDFWQFSNNPPNFSSMFDAMIFLMILNYTCTGKFSGVIALIGVLDFVPRTKYPPALLRAYGYEM